MIEPDHPKLSIGQQCKLLSIARSSFYYTPKGETEQNLGLMRQIDEQFLETPFFGVRQMTWHLRNDGHLVNEKRIRRLMRLMGLMPIYQKPNTSRPAKGHKTYPYLLKGLSGRTRSGAQTSPTCQCGAASSTWWPSWIGTLERFWPGASRTRWRPTSASRH
jgi:hypothetical protein